MPILLALVGDAGAERLPIRSYTTADGLARDHVTRIVQDSKGFLWFCTRGGLSRFDGYKFINFGTDQGLPGRYVTDFLESRTGAYWVATDKGLCRFIPDALPQATASKPQAPAQRFDVYYPGPEA
jgi:ligand-binding sensor domain-containing protein